VDSLIKSVEELNIYDGLIYASVRGSSSFIKNGMVPLGEILAKVPPIYTQQL